MGFIEENNPAIKKNIMKFNFSLDPVLKVRRHEENIQKLKLAQELQKKNHIKKLQTKVKENLEKFLDDSNENNAESIHNIKMQSLYLQQVHFEIEKLADKESNVKKSIQEVREDLEKIHQKRHILEKMKELKIDLFKGELQKHEQNNLDEISIQSFSR